LVVSKLISMQLTQVASTQEQIAQLMTYPKNTPIVMTNILKFKPRSGNGNETGKEAYMRYYKNVQPFIAKAEATLIWKGNVASTVIGDSKDQPEMILIVEYPTVDHFLQMATDPNYQKIAIDRTIALEYGGLIACKTID
jgi:uncharacterized protein (DUF1330 family)